MRLDAHFSKLCLKAVLTLVQLHLGQLLHWCVEWLHSVVNWECWILLVWAIEFKVWVHVLFCVRWFLLLFLSHELRLEYAWLVACDTSHLITSHSYASMFSAFPHRATSFIQHFILEILLWCKSKTSESSHGYWFVNNWRLSYFSKY